MTPLAISIIWSAVVIALEASWKERCASIIAKDPLGFYCRAEAGRRVQGNIKPKDLQPFRAVDEAAGKRSLTLAWSNEKRTDHTRAA